MHTKARETNRKRKNQTWGTVAMGDGRGRGRGRGDRIVDGPAERFDDRRPLPLRRDSSPPDARRVPMGDPSWRHSPVCRMMTGEDKARCLQWQRPDVVCSRSHCP